MKDNGNAEMIVNGLLFGAKEPASFSQPILFLLFVFQNAYVQLLYNQHWAFISSVLTAEEGTKAFAPIAGLGSIGSTLAAGMVSTLVERSGLIGLLYMAGVSFVVSASFADIAFGIARKNGFEPKGDADKQGDEDFSNEPTKPSSWDEHDDPISSKSSNMSSSVPARCFTKNNIFQQARTLFLRVPVLGALFFEIIISQCLSSLVNYIYLYKLKTTITDDSLRAGWSGNFYAWVNGTSGVLQFFIIPIMLKMVEAHRIWLLMPSIMLCCTVYQFSNASHSSLFAVSASFFAIKTMEYSLRGAANEMLYVSLDYESRYLGKKVISLVAGKFGKSDILSM
jgi:ATP/ADP translocase